MDNNNIQFIDQRIAHLGSLIPQCKAQSTAAEKRLANEIIALEIKRIEVIYAVEKRLSELRALIPLFKARHTTYEHVLARQIINPNIQFIKAKTTQFPTHPFVPHPLEPQPVQLNDIPGIITERPRQILNLY